MILFDVQCLGLLHFKEQLSVIYIEIIMMSLFELIPRGFLDINLNIYTRKYSLRNFQHMAIFYKIEFLEVTFKVSL